MKKIILMFFSIYLFGAFPQYYYNIKNIKKQKEEFVNILLPLIQNENKKILQTRKTIIEIFKDPFFIMDNKKIEYLSNIAKKYKIKDIFDKNEYLKKIDIIPPSLALAQAAIESGWGKSRFVKVANNIFGHWEYSNKGIKPKSKYKHIKINYSLKVFPSLEDSIAAYMLNLNRNRAYRKFREKREELRETNQTISGLILASTLKNYSQLKEKYVERVKKLIEYNNWSKFDSQTF